MRLHKILDRPSFQIHIRLLQSNQNILGQSSRLTSCRVQGMGESKPADRCLNRAARRICFPPLGASPLSPQNRCRFYRLADLGHFSTPHILTIPDVIAQGANRQSISPFYYSLGMRTCRVHLVDVLRMANLL